MAGLEPADSTAPCLTLGSPIDPWPGLESRPIRGQERMLRIRNGLTVGELPSVLHGGERCGTQSAGGKLGGYD